jgi:hypothetical protein
VENTDITLEQALKFMRTCDRTEWEKVADVVREADGVRAMFAAEDARDAIWRAEHAAQADQLPLPFDGVIGVGPNSRDENKNAA